MSILEIVIIGVDLMGPVLSLVALWLQLRSERERRRLLLAVATTLPADSRIQVHRGNGTRPTLIVGATRQDEEQQ